MRLGLGGLLSFTDKIDDAVDLAEEVVQTKRLDVGQVNTLPAVKGIKLFGNEYELLPGAQIRRVE